MNWLAFLACTLLLHDTTHATHKRSGEVVICIRSQRLHVHTATGKRLSYPISTSFYGIGGEPHTYNTPLGVHTVVRVIGEGEPHGRLFKGGVATSTCVPAVYKRVHPHKQHDHITTRIIQLDGREPHNRTSWKRGIWIHGTPYEGNIGRPSSHGCIRMRNCDIEELCRYIQAGDRVIIRKN